MKKCSKGELSNANPQACGGNAMADVPLLRHDKASEEMPSEPLQSWGLETHRRRLNDGNGICANGGIGTA
jgi:hypothetical protein